MLPNCLWSAPVLHIQRKYPYTPPHVGAALDRLGKSTFVGSLKLPPDPLVERTNRKQLQRAVELVGYDEEIGSPSSIATFSWELDGRDCVVGSTRSLPLSLFLFLEAGAESTSTS